MLHNRNYTPINITRIAAALSVALLLFVGVFTPRAGWAKPVGQSQTDMDHLVGLQGQEFEIHWLSMMIEHHQGAVDMAKLVETRAMHSELKAIAQNIIRDQNREIGDMTNWLEQWYNTEPMMGMMHESMHGGMSGMSGMDMGTLERLTGDEFDKAFLMMMHEHHRGAIAMAELVPTRATHTELKTLGENIITAQEAEIQQFMTWAMTWYNLDLMSPPSGGAVGTMPTDPMAGMGSAQPGMPSTGSPLLSDSTTTLLVLLAGLIIGAGLALSLKGRAAGRI